MRHPPPGRAERKSLRVGVLVLVSFLGACQVVGLAPGKSTPQSDSIPPGTEELNRTIYQGVLSMEGGDVRAALELVREGRRDVRGALQASSGLLADGEGRLNGRTLRIELTYGGSCPGRMVLSGEWDQDGGIFEGSVEASDCTGQSQGTFRFSTS